MIVQIYEVGSPEEARELAAMGVDHIGVLVGPGDFPRELGVERALEIFDAVERPSKRVALSLSHDVDAPRKASAGSGADSRSCAS